jgi:hypothetical protein
MFPGFATLYKDKNQNVHLYFYPGVDDEGNHIYKDLDMSKVNFNFETIENNDNSKEFIFNRKDIVEMKCKLIKNNGEVDFVNLKL